MSRIGIDCRLAGDAHAGIGRYIENLVRYLPFEGHTWFLFVQNESQLASIPDTPLVQKVIVPIRHYTVAEQVRLPLLFASYRLDLLHVPHFNVPVLYPGKMIVTIHDLLWHEEQGAHVTTLSPLVYAIKYQGYRFVARAALQKATRILVPTKTVKETIERLEDVKPHRIEVTYEGVEQRWFRPLPKIRKPEKLLVYTGSLYPHKNVMSVVEALAALPGYRLVISSSRTVFVEEFMQEVSRKGMGDRVTHAGRLSDTQLRRVYASATAVIQPSRSEGFGLTGVEALASGTPLVCSDIPIFHEVYDTHAQYFALDDTQSLVAAVLRAARTTYQERVKAQRFVRTYSWERMAVQTLSIYNQIL